MSRILQTISVYLDHIRDFLTGILFSVLIMQIKAVGKEKTLSKLSSLFSTYRLTFKRGAISFLCFTFNSANDWKSNEIETHREQ